MQIHIENYVEVLGPCTEDIRDCEIMRAVIVLQQKVPDDDRPKTIRTELAKAACSDCKNYYLKDVVIC